MFDHCGVRPLSTPKDLAGITGQVVSEASIALEARRLILLRFFATPTGITAFD